MRMSDAVNTIALVFGVLLLLKKVVNMDRFHYLRVFLITVTISCLLLYLFLWYSLGGDFDCLPGDPNCMF
jgi:hypothetical protein